MTPRGDLGRTAPIRVWVRQRERANMAASNNRLRRLWGSMTMFAESGLGLVVIGLLSGCQILDVPPGLVTQNLRTPRLASQSETGEAKATSEEAAPREIPLLASPQSSAPTSRNTQNPAPVAQTAAKTDSQSTPSMIQAAVGAIFPVNVPSASVQANQPQGEAVVLASVKPNTREGVRSRVDVEQATRGMLVAVTPADPPLPTFGATSEADPLLAVYRRGYDWFQQTDSFTCRMVRREMVSGKQHPEELMAFQYKKNPYSIHFKWLGQEGKGREVVYVEGKFDDKIQTRLAAGDIPFMPAGKRMSFTVDNPLVRSASRHSVREASFGFMLSTVGTLLAHQKEGNTKLGSVQYVGKIRRPDLGGEVEMVECKLAPGAEHTLPEGGRRLYGFDPVVGHPVLVQTFDSRGQEVEYYRYDRFFFKGLDDSDFDPEVLWAKPDVATKQS